MWLCFGPQSTHSCPGRGGGSGGGRGLGGGTLGTPATGSWNPGTLGQGGQHGTGPGGWGTASHCHCVGCSASVIVWEYLQLQVVWTLSSSGGEQVGSRGKPPVCVCVVERVNHVASGGLGHVGTNSITVPQLNPVQLKLQRHAAGPHTSSLSGTWVLQATRTEKQVNQATLLLQPDHP